MYEVCGRSRRERSSKPPQRVFSRESPRRSPQFSPPPPVPAPQRHSASIHSEENIELDGRVSPPSPHPPHTLILRRTLAPPPPFSDLTRKQLEVPRLDQFEEPEKEFTLKAESDTSSTSSEDSIDKVRRAAVFGGWCWPLSSSSLLRRMRRSLRLRAALSGPSRCRRRWMATPPAPPSVRPLRAHWQAW